jgi:hypothetical protein
MRMDRGWTIHEIALRNPMNTTPPIHPKGDCKSPLLGLPPVPELFGTRSGQTVFEKDFAPERRFAGKERRFATAECGWEGGRKIHDFPRGISMNFPSKSHPKGDCKSPLLGCRPLRSFSHKVRLEGRREIRRATEDFDSFSGDSASVGRGGLAAPGMVGRGADCGRGGG